MHRPPRLQVSWAPLLTQNSSYHHQPAQTCLLASTAEVLVTAFLSNHQLRTCAQLPFTRALPS